MKDLKYSWRKEKKGNLRGVGAVFFMICIASISFISISACAKAPARSPNQDSELHPPSPKPAFLEHEVRHSGETLGKIAAWYTGNAKNWKRLVEVNPQLKPNKIRLGQLIRIPSELVVQEKQMPQHFEARAGKKAATKVGSAELSAHEDSEGGPSQKNSSSKSAVQASSAEGEKTLKNSSIAETSPSTKGEISQGEVIKKDKVGTPLEVSSQDQKGNAMKTSAETGKTLKEGKDQPVAKVTPPKGSADGNPIGHNAQVDVAKPKETPAPPTQEDAERERLLDELLRQ